MFPISVRWLQKAGVLILAFATFIVLTGSALAAEGEGSFRMEGKNRYETAALVAEDQFTTSEQVIVARGDKDGGYADGLAASVLAGVLEAPVLLTAPETFPEATAETIANLNVQEVILLGGSSAVSDDVKSDIEAMELEVKRIAGETRFETATLIAEEASERGTLADYGFIVNGMAAPDSLVSGSAAFRDQAPILQVTENSVPSETAEIIETLGIENFYLVGGSAVLTEEIEAKINDLANVQTRLAGKDRYATSVAVAGEKFESEDNLILCAGPNENLVDAIGASVYGLPILYTQSIPPVVQDYLDETVTANSKVIIMGGEAAVSNVVENDVQEQVEQADPPPPEDPPVAAPAPSPSPPPSPEEYDLTMVVKDDMKDPLVGVRVEVNDEVKETDEDGRVVFEGLESGTYDYEVDKDGYVAEEDEVEVVDENITKEIELKKRKMEFKHLNIAGEEIAGEEDKAKIDEGDNKKVSTAVYNRTIPESGWYDFNLKIRESETVNEYVYSLNVSEYVYGVVYEQVYENVYDGTRIDFGQVTGDLEPGEYEIEVSKARRPPNIEPISIAPISGFLDVMGNSTEVREVKRPAPELKGLDIADSGDSAYLPKGAEKDVEIELYNEGLKFGEFEVELDIGSGETNKTVVKELNEGERKMVNFGDVTSELNTGEYEVNVTCEDKEMTGKLEIKGDFPQKPRFDNLDIAGEGNLGVINKGEDEDIGFEIGNDGEQEGNFEVTLDIGDGEVQKTVEKEVCGDEWQDGIFEGVTDELEPGDYDIKVSCENAESLTGELTVLAEMPQISLTGIEGEGEVKVNGQTLEIEEKVEVEEGETVKVSAEAAEGYELEEWSGDVAIDEEQDKFEAKVEEDYEIKVKFIEK